MQNTHPRVSELFHKYMDGQLTEAERQEFLDYAEDPGFHREINDLLSSAFENQSVLSDVNELGRLRLLEKIFENEQEPAITKKVNLWPRMAIAAAVAMIILGIYLFGYHNYDSGKLQSIAYANDISPGKVGATLTLSNGKKISLENARNGELANEAGIRISKTADGQVEYEIKDQVNESNKINTLSTANGETYILTLPDKSKVWMNAGSSLTYNATLNQQGVRRVKLEGEAYFEIAKDTARPFIVESSNQLVEVLGTHFNVNAYKDEAVIRTTLLEGSVKLADNGNSKILRPGNQAINNKGEINIHEANTSLVTAWKNNKFIFDRLSIQEIMRMVSRWYDVEIIYDGKAPNVTFWGSVSRFENISEVLSPLEKTGNVHFKIEGRKVYVSR